MDVDAVVIGGGPAGATVARCLALAGCHVVVLERDSRKAVSWGETCPPRFRYVLDELGQLINFRKQNYPQISGITTAWGSPFASENDFVFQPNGHGWLIP